VRYSSTSNKGLLFCGFEVCRASRPSYLDRRCSIILKHHLCFSNGSFSSISCSYKAGSGFLYPLERGFMFVPKPPVHIRFDEISCVNFARVQSGGGTSSRSFDFEVEHKNGSVITFSSIDK
jgi:hypothetical protein